MIKSAGGEEDGFGKIKRSFGWGVEGNKAKERIVG